MSDTRTVTWTLGEEPLVHEFAVESAPSDFLSTLPQCDLVRDLDQKDPGLGQRLVQLFVDFYPHESEFMDWLAVGVANAEVFAGDPMAAFQDAAAPGVLKVLLQIAP